MAVGGASCPRRLAWLALPSGRERAGRFLLPGGEPGYAIARESRGSCAGALLFRLVAACASGTGPRGFRHRFVMCSERKIATRDDRLWLVRGDGRFGGAVFRGCFINRHFARRLCRVARLDVAAQGFGLQNLGVFFA